MRGAACHGSRVGERRSGSGRENLNTEQSWEFQSAQKFNSKLMVAVETLVSVRVGLGHQWQQPSSSDLGTEHQAGELLRCLRGRARGINCWRLLARLLKLKLRVTLKLKPKLRLETSTVLRGRHRDLASDSGENVGCFPSVRPRLGCRLPTLILTPRLKMSLS